MDGIPIEELFAGATHVSRIGGIMEHAANLKARFIANKEKAVSNLALAEAEAERLSGVVLRLEGAIEAMEELEKAEAEEIQSGGMRLEPLTEEELENLPLPESEPEPVHVPLGMKIPLKEKV